jgi:anti-anti-sigma regulatory factor
LRGTVLHQFRTDLLERLQDSGATGVIIDLSGVRIMDADDFDGVRRTLDMAALMGALDFVLESFLRWYNWTWT